ncbi:ammonium transporter AmtB-like domain-containing protein [Chytriomyces cf. hyalinus JEL632]|nr:ammonium transporter AmtB-like domain-containing protein [Chytriomyces cf. hyalinus JEL632]
MDAGILMSTNLLPPTLTLLLLPLLATTVFAQTANQTNNALPSSIDSGDVAWILIASAIVFLQIPGLGLYYAGLAEQKNALATMLSVMLGLAVVFVQWTLFGFTISFSDKSSRIWIGDFAYYAMENSIDTQNEIATTIPNALLAMYQMMFAAITVGLALGGTAGRMKLFPTMVFVFLWTSLVYDPVAYWTWSNNGFLHKLGVMDYAGGSVVHITSGITGGLLAAYLGKRVDYGKRDYENHNPTYVFIGTALLWFGWMGFNGGSAGGANLRAVGAAFSTNTAAAMGGLTWMGLEKVFNKKKHSAIGFCSGVVVSLVGITPGSGYVKPGVGLVFGIVTPIACFFAIRLMHTFRLDDSLDVFACHGVGGMVGMILTGIFAQYSVTTIGVPSGASAGWISGVWMQMPIQLAGIGVTVAWTFSVTSLIIGGMSVCGLRLRSQAEDEIDGLDVSEVGELAYPFVPVPVSGDTYSAQGWV